MYGDNFSQFSIESILFDQKKELGSLARALPGLSLSSVAFPQWPIKPIKSSRSPQQNFRCHRKQRAGSSELSESSEFPSAGQSVQFPQPSLPSAAAGFSSQPLASPPASTSSLSPPLLSSPTLAPSLVPSQQRYDPQSYEPQQRYEPLAPGSPPQVPSWSASPTPTSGWPRPVCDHPAHAELGWCSWDRWSRGSIDSTVSEGLTTASTISDSVIEPADDEVTLISRPSSPQPAKVPAKVESRPPRPCLQPAKTGFALWVGNLSAHTTLMDLRDLFGTPDIQSIYLIQRTGCAFVNYSSGDALDAGIELFHRRNGKLHDHELVIKAQRIDEDQQCTQVVTPPVNSPDRFFICKSLTIEDLEMAKQKGLWSTQLRNREKFNQAFEQTENVYLVFSANRTSAFYGFARLETPFGDDLSQDEANEAFDPSDNATSGFEISRTPATYDPEKDMYVPAGEIVLDPLRGSQFWKVDGCPYAESDTEKWAAPARITWLSSPNNVVSFSRTRQLKNSLNQNKPVKVARDGTEIDPTVGRELCDMFN